MKLRIGFLGIGSMGISHVQQWHVKLAARSTCTAICGHNESNLKRALAFAPDAKVFSDERELIHSPLVDVIAISTPNFTHLPLALETLKAGKHLFLEKPCGITQDECNQLLDAASKTDRVVMIGHELRYSPYFQRIKSLVDAGEIGRPRMVWTREFRGPFQPKSQDWIQDARRSGGMLVDKNCHQFDLMNWWCGGRPARVAAFGRNAVMRVVDPAHQVNDHATVSYEYDNGVLGSLQICLFGRDFPDEELEMGIVGDAGSLQTRIRSPRKPADTPHPASGHPLPSEGRGKGEGCSSTASPNDGTLDILHWKLGEKQKEPIVHRVESKRGEGWGNHLGFDEMHAAFLDAVLDGKRPLTTVADCLDATRLCIAAEESIGRGVIVELRNHEGR
ncbi:MAG: Gfo/Idh/MocA family oxidoreductase [Verrucomicrobia bacterium]|nr:Gfo/Idh/MocA family oxidoreductase [Verrucomicrobiota bacterium]